ncbi:MAG: insulinase family protein [Acutalibacteraceae bacterium]|nr:insulinase family protein [Acutalibacteraceae bacterium]
MSAKIFSLSNGAEGLFIKNERFNTTSVSFNFYLPLSSDTAAEYALLPFILTTCGAEYPDFSVLNYKLSRLYGASLDASAEKLGDYQLLRIRISVIDDKYTFENESLLSRATDMLLSLIFNPKAENGAFCESDLNREKRKAIEHIKGELSEKRIYAKNRLIEEMYKGKPYGVPKCGTAEYVERVTGEGLYAAWKNMLEKAFIRVQVIGSSLPSRFFETIAERLEGISRAEITDCKLNEPTAPIEKPNEITERMAVKQGKLVMGFSSDLCGDDDVSLPLMVMTDIFGGGPYSKLFSNVREKMSLCYYCSASAVRQKGLITVDSGVEAENADKAKTEILNQLDAVKKGEFTDFEYEASLKSLRDSLNSYNDSQVMLDTWYALKAGNKTLYSPEEIGEKISAITREDIINATKGVKLHTVYTLLPKEEK